MATYSRPMAMLKNHNPLTAKAQRSCRTFFVAEYLSTTAQIVETNANGKLSTARAARSNAQPAHDCKRGDPYRGPHHVGQPIEDICISLTHQRLGRFVQHPVHRDDPKYSYKQLPCGDTARRSNAGKQCREQPKRRDVLQLIQRVRIADRRSP